MAAGAAGSVVGSSWAEKGDPRASTSHSLRPYRPSTIGPAMSGAITGRDRRPSNPDIRARKGRPDTMAASIRGTSPTWRGRRPTATIFPHPADAWVFVMDFRGSKGAKDRRTRIRKNHRGSPAGSGGGPPRCRGLDNGEGGVSRFFWVWTPRAASHPATSPSDGYLRGVGTKETRRPPPVFLHGKAPSTDERIGAATPKPEKATIFERGLK